MEIGVVGFVILGDDGIELYDEDLYFIDKFQNPLRNDDDTVVFSHGGPSNNAVTNHTGQMS